jgi:hypothetical protein
VARTRGPGEIPRLRVGHPAGAGRNADAADPLLGMTPFGVRREGEGLPVCGCEGGRREGKPAGRRVSADGEDEGWAARAGLRPAPTVANSRRRKGKARREGDLAGLFD